MTYIQNVITRLKKNLVNVFGSSFHVYLPNASTMALTFIGPWSDIIALTTVHSSFSFFFFF